MKPNRKSGHDYALAALEKVQMRKMRAALIEGAKCLEDVATGNGGWAWEEVIQSMREAAGE